MRHYMALILLAMALVSGCLNYRPDDLYNRYYPKRPIWWLRNGAPDPDGLLCFDSVYIARIRDEYFSTFRLWPTGQLMVQSDVVVDLERFNTFQGSGIGYYRMADGVFRTEVFGGVDRGTYGVDWGHLDSDGSIVITHFGVRVPVFQRWNLHRLPEPWVFVRTPVDLKEMTPDW